MQVPITSVCVVQDFDSSVKEFMLTMPDWLLLNTVLKLFTIFIQSYKKLQGDTYPTIPQSPPLLNKLKFLQTTCREESPLGLDCTAAYDTLNEYYTTAQQQNYATVATICDQRFNFNVFQNLWPNSNHDVQKSCVRKQFIETLFSMNSRSKG